jgi:V/A-type H+/Na+-transporting ATPase subunit E
MHTKLQELTDKIYQEGLEKGNAEAQQIVDKAKAEADRIISDAKSEAEAIVEGAKKKAAETRTNTESEIRLSGKQSLNALKQQVVDIVNGDIVKSSLNGVFEEDFLKKIIEITLANWSKSGQSMDISLLLPSDKEKSLSEYFKKEARHYIDKGLTVQFDTNLKSGFQLGPKDGSYKVSFTDEDFINFFKQYLRPKLVEFLFSAE